MCVAIPGKILSIDGIYANVDIMGVESKVNIQLIELPKVGEYILIHAGCGIQKINLDYFSYIERILKDQMEC